MTDIAQIQGIFTSMEGTVIADLQTTDQVADYMVRLSGWLAFVNEQMALTHRALNIAKRDAYTALQKRYEDSNSKLSPMLAKDYVASLCSAQAFNYDMAERCSRTIVHTIDALRSILSMKKEEMRALPYAGT